MASLAPTESKSSSGDEAHRLLDKSGNASAHKIERTCDASKVLEKLNFGCGHRFAPGWVNIDFHSESPEVRRVNLLKPWPFPDDHFDVVYSSHTLEHFSPGTGERLLRECYRVMKPGAVIRIVVPDLENSCREYLRVLDQVDTSEEARRRYRWIILELLDQLVRTEPSGLMQPFFAELQVSNDRGMMEYVRARTDNNPWGGARGKALNDKLRKLRFNKILNKCIYIYVAAVKRLFPGSLREAVVDNTRIGEKHRWMYDRYSMGELMKRSGFREVLFPGARSFKIPGFDQDCLDINPDGTVYKPASLFCEAIRPPE